MDATPSFNERHKPPDVSNAQGGGNGTGHKTPLDNDTHIWIPFDGRALFFKKNRFRHSLCLTASNFGTLGD